ncbi:Na+/H+ antiporter NhaC [Mesobacillus boroniphilus]|uniref:Na+/H+ antiporter NhaC n=1 Tax=Mesobacillus boroniphilus TaxID=308892 RepID=A0A944CN83_9BACI|nr:Na+/H+ antiporter NhaC [Mesobacillus boroniphilus]MBS8265670.1 Na+/H+ antiporter NhaC [Mesobacillus boroniphilus]
MKKEPGILLSIFPLLALVSAAAATLFFWKAGMFIPLITGILATAIVGLVIGFKWEELQGSLVNGVSKALPAVFILFIIGTIVGTWILSGVIPTLIHYGLLIINPKLFLPTVVLTTGIIAITLGSSFTAIATIGLAFMAVGQGMDFSPAIIAGAIISGAYFGDKLSPLSDTTNVAPAMVDTNLFAHIRHMLWDTIPAFILTILLFFFLGFRAATGAAASEEIQNIMAGLQNAFTIHPLLLLIPIFTIFLMIKRYPAIPSLVIVSLLGGLIAVVVQGNSISEMINAMTSGYKSATGIQAIDSLLTRGGITSMLSTIGLVIAATALGGILEETGIFKRIIKSMLTKTRSTGSLILSTILSTLVVGFASGAQFLAIILPARAFTNVYKERGLDTKNLSRSVEAAGTVGINLVPWSVPAVFAGNILGVSPAAFIPFVFFAYLVIIINIIYGYTGISISKKNYDLSSVTAEPNVKPIEQSV